MTERAYLEDGPLHGETLVLPAGVYARDGVTIQDRDCELFYARYRPTRRRQGKLPVLKFDGYTKKIATLNLNDQDRVVITS